MELSKKVEMLNKKKPFVEKELNDLIKAIDKTVSAVEYGYEIYGDEVVRETVTVTHGESRSEIRVNVIGDSNYGIVSDVFRVLGEKLW